MLLEIVLNFLTAYKGIQEVDRLQYIRFMRNQNGERREKSLLHKYQCISSLQGINARYMAFYPP